jgi:tryptophan-rich sensory protein
VHRLLKQGTKAARRGLFFVEERTPMDLLQDVGDKLEDTLNAEGRDPGHVTLGVVVCIGVVAVSALLAARAEPSEFQRSVARHSEADNDKLSQVWPTLFSLTTLAALRIWNAEHSPARTRALSLWGLSQVFHGIWMTLSPRQRILKIGGGVATAALTAAYAQQARRVDVKAGGMVAPMAGMAIANLFTGELWRQTKPDRAQVAGRTARR